GQARVAGAGALSGNEVRRDRDGVELRSGNGEGARVSSDARIGADVFRARKGNRVMTCDESKVFLSEYWSQTLGETQELALEGHLAMCAACRAESERLGTLWRGLSLLPAEEPSANLRTRFYETLGAYRHGLEASSKGGNWIQKLAAFWPKQPAFQMGLSFALLVIGVSIGYGMRSADKNDRKDAASELATLRGEVSGMRQMVALSLMQQQSASERLRGVSFAYRAESSDTEVLAA